MNTLKGEIEQIDVNGNLTLVSIKVSEFHFKSIVVETPQTVDYLVVGKKINVLFKETEVILGRGENIEISLRNKMPATIIQIEKGVLLAKVVMETSAGNVISIITSNAVENLKLKVGAEILAMVKTNEILIAE